MADLGEIDELKRYIRGLATNIQLKHQYLPLKEISLSSLLLNYQQTFFHNGIRLNLHLNNSLEGIPLKGYELTIVFANLLVNSFEYLQHDEELKRQIDLTVDFYDSYYRIEVMNEYIGQPEEILTNFLRESKSDLNKTRGLGLSNVNYIVKLYNGQLFPELTSNKMLSMVVIIPI
ncbi:GHKL domain-containing protein [Bacillus cereus]|nr:GHKL domain-containing protein [Bacillus cereus]